MKNLKRICVFLIAAFFAVQLNAQSLQKIFRVDSNEYTVIKQLYLLQGKAMPSSTGPWSAAELLEMTYKIDTEEIPAALIDEYNDVLANIKRNGETGSEKINFNFDGEMNFENYIHTNTDGSELHDINYADGSWNKIKLFSGRKNWSYDLTKISPFFAFKWETWVAKAFYGWFEFPLMNTFTTATQIGDTNFNSNVLLLQNYTPSVEVLDMNFPYRAFVSFGSDVWSVQIGRDRLNWGLGRTGNLIMSDNLPYHNMLRFTAFSESYKYTFLTSFFPHEANYHKADGKYVLTGSPNDDMVGTEYYIAHRIEGRFFNDRLAATITEGIMYAAADGRIQFETLNPVSFYHNNYTTSSNNSILDFELDWTAFNGFNVYGQLVVDEFQFAFEKQEWPNGIGYLGGVNYAAPLFGGLFTVNAEGAHTDPYTYIRYKEDPWNPESEKYGIDFIVANRVFSMSLLNRAVYEEYCLGYKYGPDCITANLNVGWKKQKLELGLNYFFMGHGTHDFWTTWTTKKSFDDNYIKEKFTTPTTKHESTNYRFDNTDLRDSVWYTNVITLGASYQIMPSLKVFGQADYVISKNAFNLSSNGVETDLQLVLGVKWNCF